MEHQRAVPPLQPPKQIGGGPGDQRTMRGFDTQKKPWALFEYDTSRLLVCW